MSKNVSTYTNLSKTSFSATFLNMEFFSRRITSLTSNNLIFLGKGRWSAAFN